MIVFCIINPGLTHPFAMNSLLENATGTSHLDSLEKLVKFKKRLKPQEKYTSKHTGDWPELWKVYEMCAEFKPSERPRIDDVVTLIQNVNEESCALSPATVSEFHLKVC